jgi:hypothetical protein
METAKFIVQAAKFYIGQTEKPNNGGFTNKSFEAEMVKAGFYKGAPWCAFFAKLILLKAYTNNVGLKAIVNSHFNGSALQTLNNLKNNKTFTIGTVPIIGAVVIWANGKGLAGHVGIVGSVDLTNNTMQCIEGNTNNSGSREGYQVAIKTRTINREFRANGLNIAGYIYPI